MFFILISVNVITISEYGELQKTKVMELSDKPEWATTWFHQKYAKEIFKITYFLLPYKLELSWKLQRYPSLLPQRQLGPKKI